MTTTRKIAVYTGNRAEYGVQYPILRTIAADPRLEHYLLVGGAHLERDFGSTAAEIVADGLKVHARIPVQTDGLSSTPLAIAAGISGVSRVLGELRPDFLLVYGDRFESFAALIAGTQMNIATAHVEGGDYTEGGALDDSVRHAMTKLAHLHFTTNSQAAERVCGLGEEPWRVFNVGLPALDLVQAGLYESPEKVACALGLDISRPAILFCQHSVTTEFHRAGEQVQPSIAALVRMAALGSQVVVTWPNNDAGGRQILDRIEELAARRLPGIQVVPSLGRRRFHGMLHLIGRLCRGAFAGNSSAGIKETPAFGCPVVNIGSRQQGRLRADNVIDAPYDAEAIFASVRRCVEDESFRLACRTCVNPYGAGNAGPRIAEVLATLPLDARLLRKRMTF